MSEVQSRMLVIGDVTVDHFMTLDQSEAGLKCELNTHACTISLPYGEKLPAERYDRVIAGNAANAAVGAARLGLPTSIWTLMGDDETGREAKTQFEREGIDVSHLVLAPGQPSNTSVVLRVLAERTIIVYHVRRRYELPSTLNRAAWVYLTSMSEGWEHAIPALDQFVDDNHTKLVFQPGTFQLRSGPHVARSLLERTHVFVCNLEEAADYTGHQRGTSVRTLSVSLHAHGPKIVVITDGTNGSYVSDGQQLWKLGARDDIERIDATGAGDAYASGFTAAIAQDEPIERAMQWGNLNAESVIGQIGAQAGILTVDEVTQRLEDPKTLAAEVVHG